MRESGGTRGDLQKTGGRDETGAIVRERLARHGTMSENGKEIMTDLLEARDVGLHTERGVVGLA